jgi:hypothetical protein
MPFPRSIAGKYQNDPLMGSILRAKGEGSINELSATRIISAISGRWDSSYPTPMRDYLDTRWPRAIDFFQAVIERLRYLETREPTAGDYAVEAIQDAFVGLMYGKYDWGKKGNPTKGEVTKMAKAILKRQGKSKKSGWTELLRTADLDWLPEGAAGRPSSLEVDQNLKAKQEFLSKQTQYVNDVLGGDWSLLNHKAGHVFGGKHLAQQHETERLEQYGSQELPADEEGLE